MGSVCIALGELHTWEALLFSVSGVPDVGESKPTQSGAWHCHLPHPMEANPKTSFNPSPPQFRWPFKIPRVKGDIGDSQAREQDTPKTTYSHHIGAAPDGHC